MSTFMLLIVVAFIVIKLELPVWLLTMLLFGFIFDTMRAVYRLGKEDKDENKSA